MASDSFTYGTIEYFKERVKELENERDKAQKLAQYYQDELAKSHELLGRVVHQTSERWDTVRLTKYFPTDNLHNMRTQSNPESKTKNTENQN